MLSFALGLVLRVPASPADYDVWARGKNVAEIEAAAVPELAGKFAFLRQVGAFGVGSKGWRAESLNDVEGEKRYVVFTTPLTSQDRGDQVFEYDGSKLTRLVSEKEWRGMRLTDLDFDLRFEPTKKLAHLKAKATFYRTGDSEASFFVRLSPNYRVSTVTNWRGEPVKFAQSGGVVSLPTPDRRSFEYTFTYSGEVNLPGYAGAIVDDEVMLTNDYWWPHIARQPIRVKTTSTVPMDWTVVSQGNRVSREIIDDQLVVKYENLIPVSYLSYSAGKFRVAERKLDDVRYFIASRLLTEEELADQLEFVPPVIEFFSRFAPFPYKEYGAVDTDLYGGGALEAYSYATYGHGWLPDEDPDEPSHTWWGGLISNTYLDTFWNESFASFSEGFYAREGSIGDRDAKRRAFVSQASMSPAYDRAAIENVGADGGGLASSLGYGKGGDVLQQLEFEMGTQKFSEVLAEWLAGHNQFEEGGWNSFESVCGPEWTWFFDQWIRRPGCPKISSVTAAQGGKLNLSIQQAAPYYQFKVDLAIRTSQGVVYEVVDVVPDESGNSRLELDVTDAIIVSVDPFDRLLQPGRPRLGYRLSEAFRTFKVYDPSGRLESRQKIESLPTDLSDVMIAGSPSDISATAPLWAKSGVVFESGKATYQGQTVDLKEGAVMAVVEFAPGKWVGLYAGMTKYGPKTGISSIAMVDQMGRFLTGSTEPRWNGSLVVSVARRE
jgi:hypothetical protein